eukprot:3926235-Amphidinium_carterae.3
MSTSVSLFQGDELHFDAAMAAGASPRGARGVAYRLPSQSMQLGKRLFGQLWRCWCIVLACSLAGIPVGQAGKYPCDTRCVRLSGNDLQLPYFQTKHTEVSIFEPPQHASLSETALQI